MILTTLKNELKQAYLTTRVTLLRNTQGTKVEAKSTRKGIRLKKVSETRVLWGVLSLLSAHVQTHKHTPNVSLPA